MKFIITLAASLLMHYAAVAQQQKIMLDHYMALKEALTVSNVSEAAVQAKNLKGSAEASAGIKEKKELLSELDRLTLSKDIESQRSAFARISVILWKSVKKSGKPHRDIYYFYCPMKKTYWMSYEPSVRNPYYGSKMLTCGNVSDKIKA